MSACDVPTGLKIVADEILSLCAENKQKGVRESLALFEKYCSILLPDVGRPHES